MNTNAEFQGGWWTTDFAAPPGQDLAAGTTYQAKRYPFNDGAAGFNHSGNGRGCNELTATFTVREIAFHANGVLRRFRADFEQHCEGGDAGAARHLGLQRVGITAPRSAGRPGGRRPARSGKVVALATTSTKETSVASTTLVVPSLLHRPSTAGATYWGPGDMYRFLVTGEETGGAVLRDGGARPARRRPAARTPTPARTRRSTSSRAASTSGSATNA